MDQARKEVNEDQPKERWTLAGQPTWAYRARVLKILAVDLRAEQADAPGVAKEICCGLHNALPAGEIVLSVPIEVPTQA